MQESAWNTKLLIIPTGFPTELLLEIQRKALQDTIRPVKNHVHGLASINFVKESFTAIT